MLSDVAELPVPDAEPIEGAKCWGLDTVGPEAEVLDPGVIPAVGVLGDRRRDDLRAVEVEARALRVVLSRKRSTPSWPVCQPRSRPSASTSKREVAGFPVAGHGRADALLLCLDRPPDHYCKRRRKNPSRVAAGQSGRGGAKVRQSS
jgi:hypothetical protein